MTSRTNEHLNFSEELLDLNRDLWDYVIVHELLYFSVPNHGKLWKSLMLAHLGDWEPVARRLPGRSAKSEGRDGSPPPAPKHFSP